jgi:hypothetical protein
MIAEVVKFVALVLDSKVRFNRITGVVLHYLVERAGGVDALGDSEPATAIRLTLDFLGKTGATALIAQDQADLLLPHAQKLLPKSNAVAEPPAPEPKEPVVHHGDDSEVIVPGPKTAGDEEEVQ